ncbi:MAG: glycosyltransferase [Propioniciclava sp.]
MTYDVSIIVPTFNAVGKMDRMLRSLEDVHTKPQWQVIFVDDCSTDTTATVLERFVQDRPTMTLLRMSRNSGSAAAPRNRGLAAAEGEFVFFLDCDDALIPSGLEAALAHAADTQADIVRMPLLLQVLGEIERRVDTIPGWNKLSRDTDRLRAVVRHQSLTASCLLRTSLLHAHHLAFDPHLRIGEDISFVSAALAEADRLEYVDFPCRTYVRQATADNSVTQTLRSSDFADFFRAWRNVQGALVPRGVSFIAEHGFASISYALRQYVWFQLEEPTPADFAVGVEFVQDYWDVLAKMPFPARQRALLHSLFADDRDQFISDARRRVVVAGHDLKFIEGLIGEFEVNWRVLRDKWSGHRDHDEGRSQELLEWADLIVVEWLLGAAEWYSQHVRSHQRLIVRAHRSEVGSSIGDGVRFDRTNAVVTIAAHCFNDFADRFDIPRDRLRLIPNGIDVRRFLPGDDTQRDPHLLAMVGAVPALKGLARAIELLRLLREQDSRYRLVVVGKAPEEYEWVWSNPAQRVYFEACRSRIIECGLESSIEHSGWVDPVEIVQQAGFVLSLSDYEGHQVAPSEAMAAGSAVLVRRWRGAEDCFPQELLFETLDEAAARIQSLQNPRRRREYVRIGTADIREHYSLDQVGAQWRALMRDVGV